MENKLKQLMKTIGYSFKEDSLLKNALYHTSYINEHHMHKEESNERLEFLGDAVLELITSEFLFKEHPTLPEGNLTKIRASIVCEQALAYCARQIDLGSYLYLGKGEDLTGGRNRESVTSDALEALIGAIYLDGGLASAKEFIHNHILNDLEEKKLFYDSKTILQEIVQSDSRSSVDYILTKEEGPDHDKCFYVHVEIDGKTYGEGRGKTKKASEQEAAYKTILMIRKEKKS
ncbi:MAG TPA: ribonuclease III [Candidatus Dorea intestinavium]|nr:ribonuclease III [Candidatus Dorea intestinavium]